MSNEDKKGSGLSDNETAAIAVTSTILIFMLVYWTGQIQSVLELLELAYG